jgi:MFS family permease
MSRTLYDCPRISRRVTGTLFAAQSLGRAAFVACSTVGALVAVQLGGQAVWAGVPAAVLQLTGAFAALGVAALTEQIGRRKGLALGLAVGALGTAVAAVASVVDALPIFLGGLMLMGVASAAMLLGRFAVAEVHAPERRGQAISNVVIGGAVGSIVGTLVVAPMGRLALRFGMNELAGPYLAGVVILSAASLATVVWLRPDPRDVGRKMAAKHPEPVLSGSAARPVTQVMRTPAVLAAISTMAFSQMAMVTVMVISTLHMKDHGHTLTHISVVIASHTLGMFGLSWIAGRLTDRWGRGPVMLVGTGLLVLACALAPLFAGVLPLSVVLFVLGFGWSCCFVAGSTVLSDQLAPPERAMVQGTSDLLIGVVTAAASLGGGLLFAYAGYSSVCIAGAVLSMLGLGLTVWWVSTERNLRIAWS